MQSLSNREEIRRNTDEGPDMDRLKSALKETASDLSFFANQTNCNYDQRNQLWPGQDIESGRKKGSPSEPAYPWEDASDIRPFVSDSIIRENKALFSKALLKGNLTAIPTEGNDIERAKMVSQFMKWMLAQTEDIDRCADIVADYQEEKGIGAVGIFWETKVEEVMQTINLEQLLSVEPEVPEQGAQLVALIQEPDTTGEATDLLQQYFPDLSRRKARKMVNELRKTGQTSVGRPEIIHNKPVLKPYTFDEDLFVQPNIIDIQDAPYIFQRVYYTPEELRAKVLVEDWDEEWVDDVIENATGNEPDSIFNNSEFKFGSRRAQTENRTDDASGFVAVYFAYEKATTEDNVPGVFITAMHPDIENYGMSKLLDYKPARYPFVVFPREYRTKRLFDSRGVPELAKGFEDEIKVQQDSRVDRTQLSTCPAREHPLGRPALNFGPGDSVPVRRQGEYGYIQAPPGNIGDSIEIEKTVRENMMRMFGRQVPGEDPQHALDVLQKSVDQWLRCWKKVMDQMWDLHQQFGNDTEFFRVIGSNTPEAMQFVRAEGSERFDFYLDYPVVNSDAASLFDKLNAMGDVAAKLDRQGRFDYDELLSAMASTIDTSYADRFMKPLQVATEEEIRKTQEDIAKISSGQSVNAPPNANVDLRMKVVQEYLQGTEDIPADDVQARLQNDEFFQSRINKYLEQLQFQKVQQQNAIIGQLGTQPGNALPS